MEQNFEKGSSIIELIIALVLISIALTAVVGLVIKGVSNNTYNRNKSLATGYAEQSLEWLRSERDLNWKQFYARSLTTTWCIPTLSWSGSSHSGSCSQTEVISQTPFIRELTLVRTTTPTISVTATVSVKWTDSAGLHSSESTTNFTNWKGNQ